MNEIVQCDFTGEDPIRSVNSFVKNWQNEYIRGTPSFPPLVSVSHLRRKAGQFDFIKSASPIEAARLLNTVTTHMLPSRNDVKRALSCFLLSELASRLKTDTSLYIRQINILVKNVLRLFKASVNTFPLTSLAAPAAVTHIITHSVSLPEDTSHFVLHELLNSLQNQESVSTRWMIASCIMKLKPHKDLESLVVSCAISAPDDFTFSLLVRSLPVGLHTSSIRTLLNSSKKRGELLCRARVDCAGASYSTLISSLNVPPEFLEDLRTEVVEVFDDAREGGSKWTERADGIADTSQEVLGQYSNQKEENGVNYGDVQEGNRWARNEMLSIVAALPVEGKSL